MNSDNPTTQYIPGTPNQKWTPRWAELDPHPEQVRLWNDPHRFKIVPAGRRSGKTEIAKRRLAVAAMVKRKPPGRYFAAAPTRDQAKRIWWADLKAMIPKDWRAVVSESELWMRTTTGAEIWVVGLDKPDRIEGSPWDGGIIDELASCKGGIWDANIRPALSTRGREGWCWLIGVPDVDGPSQVEYEKLYEMAAGGHDPEWAAFSWASADILSASEVESARRRLDKRLFEQEYLGKFMLSGGRAFPDFDPSPGGIHVRDDIATYDPALPICWCLDFNVNPMCSGVIQHSRGIIRVIEDIEIPDTVTPAAVREFLDRAATRGWDLTNLCIYGDAAGNQRHTTASEAGETDWLLVKNILRNAGVQFRMKVPGRNPAISDTRNALNAKLKSATDEVTLFVHSRCRRLIDDLRSALWPSKDDLAEQHCLAWLRYFAHWEYPIRSNSTASDNRTAVLR